MGVSSKRELRRVQAVVVTCDRPEPHLAGTLGSLAAAGWPDPIVVRDPPDEEKLATGPWPTTLRALERALSAPGDAPGVLLVQDDCIMASGLKSLLEGGGWPERAENVGVCSLYTCGAHTEAHETKPGWWRLPDSELPGRGWGAVCLLFPRASAERLLASGVGRGSRTKVDLWVGEFCRREKLGYWLHTPSLAQHVSTRSAVDPDSDHRSPDYVLAADFCADLRDMMGPATGVVLSWRRPRNIERIVHNMLDTKWIVRVVVWNNSQSPEAVRELKDVGSIPEVWLVNSRTNRGTMARYEAATMAETELVATCDDDVMVGDWDKLYWRHAATGRLACYLDPGHMRWAGKHYAHRYNGGTAHETLVGWGAVLRREWVGVLGKYAARFGEDQLLMDKADRIFTVLLDRPHENIRADVRHLDGATGREAVYRRDSHWSDVRRATDRAVVILEDGR